MARATAYVDAFPWSWRVPLVACLISVLTIGYYRCFGILMLAYEAERAYPHSILLGVYAFSYALNGLLAPFIQVLVARWTSRRVVFVGGLLLFACLSLQEVLQDVVSFVLLSGIGMGLGFSMIYSTAICLVGPTFRKYRATATGIAFVGSSIGQMVLPWTVTVLVEEYTLRGCVLILGAVMLHASVGALLLPDRIVDRSTGEVIVDQTKTASSDKSKRGGSLSSALLSSLPFLPVVIFVNFSYSNQHPTFPSFAEEHGHSQEWVSGLIFVQGICDFCSRLSTGVLADRLSIRGKIWFVGIALLFQSAGLFLLLLRPSWTPSFFIYIVDFGLTGGIYFVNWTVILAFFVGRAAIPRAVAISMAIADVIHLPATFLLGVWRDNVSSYATILWSLNAVMIAAGLYSLIPLTAMSWRREKAAGREELVPLLGKRAR